MPLTHQDQLLIEIWSAQHNVPFSNDIIEKVESYCDLIASWSKRMNLISRGDLAHLIERHFLDSLVPLDVIPKSGRLLDVGSGAGFPAIPLALLRPSIEFALAESMHKRALFLRTVIERLSLSNAKILETRLEYIDSIPDYDIITIRALPNWEKFKKKMMALLKPGGTLIYYEKRGVIRQIEKD